MGRVPAKPTVISVLRSSTLLNSVRTEDLEELTRSAHLAFAERGEIIWLGGTPVDFFGLVGTGFVKMVQGTAHGHEITHEIMGPGQIFGMLGMIEGTGCPLSARAVTHVWYLKVPKREFFPVYEQNVVLKDHVVRRTTGRLRKAHEMLALVSTGTVESRVAAVLVMLAESYGRPTEADAVVIDVPLTRQDVAEMAGTTVESTIRVMSKWQKAGLVETQSKFITISDLDRLAQAMRI
jgi:CRP/FNR family transcriptional regulator